MRRAQTQGHNSASAATAEQLIVTDEDGIVTPGQAACFMKGDAAKLMQNDFKARCGWPYQFSLALIRFLIPPVYQV